MPDNAFCNGRAPDMIGVWLPLRVAWTKLKRTRRFLKTRSSYRKFALCHVVISTRSDNSFH